VVASVGAASSFLFFRSLSRLLGYLLRKNKASGRLNCGDELFFVFSQPEPTFRLFTKEKQSKWLPQLGRRAVLFFRSLTQQCHFHKPDKKVAEFFP
jgi:hypothetical protein